MRCVQPGSDFGNSAGPWGVSGPGVKKSAAKHPEDICTANTHELADRGVCGSTCQLCSFYLLILPVALLTEQIDPTGDSNQTVLLGRGKCPRLPWAVCDKDNSGKEGSVIPLIPGCTAP